MLKRHKILLSLLERFGGELSNTDMQKYLFLLCQSQEKPSYHFVPYKYGCFSFQAYQDKHKLTNSNVLHDSDSWCLKKKGFYDSLSSSQRILIWNIRANYERFKGEELIKYIYKKYPYYAINSEIALKLMTKDELAAIEKCRTVNQETGLFTLGYEGYSLEEYMNILIKHNIRVICDVRKNPISRKYGFSKKTLENALASIGIKYVHIPQLGIPGELRRNLKNQQDYDELFVLYEREILNNAMDYLNNIQDLLRKEKRVALLCYEKEPCRCHRTRIRNALLSQMAGKVDFQDLQ